MLAPVLETERLILRPFAENDAADILTIHSDPEVNRFLPWFPLETLAQAKEFYQTRLTKPYHYALCLKEDNRPIGYLNLSEGESRDLGYGLRREFWRRGLITEAGRALIQRLRREGLPYLTATHDVKNPRSGAVMRRLGMRYCYSYEEMWEPKHIPVVFRLYQLNLDGAQDRVYPEYWRNSPVHFVEPGL